MLKRNIKEEERIERIIRGLIKLPENKRCINCNSLGPQYVCTTFWTFVCTNCSGVHREFTHRVKSVSMAKFSADEVAALQAGGNEQARKTYFKTWDAQRNPFPDSSNLHRLRDFIKHVYVDRKYSGERNNERVFLDKTGAKDEYCVQRSSENSKRFNREYFFECHTSEKADQDWRDDSYDRHSFRNLSPMSSGRTLRYYVEERSSPRYRQENLRPASRRRHSSHFEIVDDRFREDGVRSGRRLESDSFSDADFRAQSSSPVCQNDRSKTYPPPVHPVKHILGDNVPPLKLGEPPKANEMQNIECSTQVQKEASSTTPGSTDKREKDHIVNALNLIDFDVNFDPPATTEVVQSQQNVPSSEGGNISAPTSTNEKASNTPDMNSMDFLLFELSGPAVAPLDNTSERPPEGDTLSTATEDPLNTEAAVTPASTTNASSSLRNSSSAQSLVNQDIFASNHLSFAAAAPGWQFRPHYGMGYGTMVSQDSVKSRNPFDLGDDGIQFQAAMFPSMSSFQEALPNTSASPGPWPQQLPHSFKYNSQGMSYQMIPPGVYMGQQLANNMMPSIAQTVNNAGDNADAFASLNPIQHSSSSNPSSAGPTSHPSTKENPFG